MKRNTTLTLLLATFTLSLLLGVSTSALAGVDRLYFHSSISGTPDQRTSTEANSPSGYAWFGPLGYISDTDFPGGTPLYLDFSSSRQDSKTSTDTNPESGYTRQNSGNPIGYISSVQYAGTIPLYLDWSAAFTDNSTSTADSPQGGFTRVRTLGYIWPDVEKAEVVLYEHTFFSGSNVAITSNVRAC